MPTPEIRLIMMVIVYHVNNRLAQLIGALMNEKIKIMALNTNVKVTIKKLAN